jgi:hypothetical protein
MSRAIASARQRRAGVTPPEPPSIQQPQNSAPAQANGLTLPQVIALVDSRLIKLEKFMKDTQEGGVEKTVRFASDPSDATSTVSDTVTDGEGQIVDIGTVLDDFNNRFIVLAEEIAQIKDTIMKLQTYTMDVNKMLLEERVNVLSDLGENNTMFVLEDTTLNTTEIVPADA